MKTLLQCALVLVVVLPACNDHVIDEMVEEAQQQEATAATSCITYLIGDKDGFGIGLKENDPFVVEAGKSLPIDYRKPEDIFFTDIYPAWLGNSNSREPVIVSEFQFGKPAKAVVSAKLKMLTLGIQDGDTQVYGSDVEIKLFIDGVEVPYAFDTVDQFELRNGVWSDFVGAIELDIPENLLYLFSDGNLLIRLEVHQQSSISQSIDAFAIDFCELEICIEAHER
jgi:hypothetical protein